MIERFGVGIDITTINRFKKLPYSTNQKFYKKIFQLSEINYCLKFKNSAEHFAGKFAIKEAVKKSISEDIEFLDIHISHYRFKPKIILLKKRPYKFIASISHDDNLAIAIVMSEKTDVRTNTNHRNRR